MKFILPLAALFLATSAFAEDAPTQPTPAPQPAPAAAPAAQKYYLEVDAADLDVISKALVELPFKTAQPLLLKLNGQLSVQGQIKDAADKSAEAEKAKKRK